MLLAVIASGGVVPLRAAPPNVVVVMTDDQGYGDLSFHGNPTLRTPQLDRFARYSAACRRFYGSPVCSPTRASLLTGRYHYRTGVIHTSRGGAKMHGDETTLAEFLRAAGYVTGIFGKWHLGDNYPLRPQDQGFLRTLFHTAGGIGQPPDRDNSYFHPRLWRDGELIAASGYCSDVFTDAALEFIRQHRDRPFFVYLPYNAPHTPLEVQEQAAAKYRLAGCDDTTARVYAMIENIDDNFGRLLQALDDWSLTGNTLVVFLTDNGPQQARYNAGLRGRKAAVYEGGVRVPCFLRWPDGFPGSVTLPVVAAHIDLLPTILDACHVTVPATAKRIDGISLLPWLTGQATAPAERLLFLQCHRGLSPERYHNAAVIGPRFKLVAHPTSFAQERLPTDQPPDWELYDLEHDPAEQVNLAGRNPDEVRSMAAAYEAWFSSVRDERQFQPGVIQLGSEAENPVRLCRYQDGTFEGEQFLGWDVEVTKSGRYQISFVQTTAALKTADSLVVRWRGETLSPHVGADGTIIELSNGIGRLLIREPTTLQPETDKAIWGDVLIARVGDLH